MKHMVNILPHIFMQFNQPHHCIYLHPAKSQKAQRNEHIINSMKFNCVEGAFVSSLLCSLGLIKFSIKQRGVMKYCVTVVYILNDILSKSCK